MELCQLENILIGWQSGTFDRPTGEKILLLTPSAQNRHICENFMLLGIENWGRKTGIYLWKHIQFNVT